MLGPTVSPMPQRHRTSPFAGPGEQALELNGEWALVYRQPYPDANQEDCHLVQLNAWLPGGTGRIYLGRLPPDDLSAALGALVGVIDLVERMDARPDGPE